MTDEKRKKRLKLIRRLIPKLSVEKDEKGHRKWKATWSWRF